MDKKIQEHSSLMRSGLDKIKKEIKEAKKKQDSHTAEEIDALRQYHEKMVRNFQHERLIHLIVTLFFAMMTLSSVGGVFILSTSSVGGTYSIASNVYIPALLLVLILLVLVGFYIRHYYHLENGTQKLYEFSKEILDIKKNLN